MSLVRLALRSLLASPFRSALVGLCVALVAGSTVWATLVVQGAQESLRLSVASMERLEADLEAQELAQGLAAYLLFERCGLCKTRGEARRLLSQGGGYVNGKRIDTFDQVVSSKDLANFGTLIFR